MLQVRAHLIKIGGVLRVFMVYLPFIVPDRKRQHACSFKNAFVMFTRFVVIEGKHIVRTEIK